MEIKFRSEGSLAGTAPVVILGPNGSGKTRYGRQIAEWNDADVVAALRNIALEESIPMQSLVQADQELQNHKRNRRRHPWSISSEINNLFAKLMAEDSASATRFRDSCLHTPGLVPETTKLMRLTAVWQRLFPGRHISFAGYSPKVTSEYVAGEQAYAAREMSDGERVALYLAGRVLESEANVILIDEPEVHFHSRLAAQFWDELERLRDDCRFVYITHDLAFARSRQTTQFLIVRPGKEPELVDVSQGVPGDIVESILSAASFSIFADTLVFCEGSESSLDQRLLRAWFRQRTVAVIPVGSCRDVIRCTTTFREQKILANVTSIGLIDHDYWPQQFLDSRPSGVEVLPVHEIESVFCVKGLFVALAEHLGKSLADADSLYQNALDEARARFVDGLLLKQASERFRSRCESQARSALNTLSVDGTEAQVKQNHCDALSPSSWTIQPAAIFDEELLRLKEALQHGDERFLRLFPGKVYFSFFAKKLGLEKDAYVSLVLDALNAGHGAPLEALGEKIRAKLKPVIQLDG